MRWDSPRVIIYTLAIASLVATLPLMFLKMGSDLTLHYALIGCFAEQFWQGDAYPRWCFAANAGLGAPLFLFYFPLPYYVISFIYPLTGIGISYDGLYALSVLLATFVTALTCFTWLKDIITPTRALLATALFLILPYRTEILFFRMAYAEIWCLAFVPLVALYTRRLAKGKRGTILPLAVSVALTLLSHVPLAIITILFMGLYLVCMRWKALIAYGYAVGAALCATAFYLVPGHLYLPFIRERLIEPESNWPNMHFSLDNVLVLNQWMLSLKIGVGILFFVTVSWLVNRGKKNIPNRFIQLEITAWNILFCAALFLFSVLSKPLYDLFLPLSKFILPWRMQAIFCFATIYMVAIIMQRLATARQFRTWKIDYTTLLVFFALISIPTVSLRPPEFETYRDAIIDMKWNTQPEHQSIWADRNYFNRQYIIPRYEKRATIPKATLVSGQGKIQVINWKWSGIHLKTESKKPFKAKLDHLYFPVWQAVDEGGRQMVLSPENKTGQMLLDIPAGKHDIRLSYDVAAIHKPLIHAANLLSLITILIFMWFGTKERRRKFYV